MDYYMKIIKETSIFMIIAEMLLQLVPSSEYVKYMRFLLDLICIMLLFLPIISAVRNVEITGYAAEVKLQDNLLNEEISSWEDQISMLLIENIIGQNSEEAGRESEDE